MPSRQASKQATADRVVTAADRMFRERGFQATTIRDIAAEAGVSAGTVMAVGDKHALLVRIFDSAVAARLSEAPKVLASATCAERLMRIVHPFIAIFGGEAALARRYASILASGEHRSALLTELTDELLEKFAFAVTERGCTPQPEAAALAEALYAAYTGTLFLFASRGSEDADALETEVAEIFTTICTCKE